MERDRPPEKGDRRLSQTNDFTGPTWSPTKNRERSAKPVLKGRPKAKAGQSMRQALGEAIWGAPLEYNDLQGKSPV